MMIRWRGSRSKHGLGIWNCKVGTAPLYSRFVARKRVSAETIARLADEGQDISSYFTNDGKIMPPLESGEIDPSEDTNEKLNEAARENRGTDSLL